MLRSFTEKFTAVQREIKNKLIKGIRSGACSFHDHARWEDSILDWNQRELFLFCFCFIL